MRTILLPIYLLSVAGCTAVPSAEPTTVKTEHCEASVFRPQKLATGGWYAKKDLLVAHRTASFGTKLRITHLQNKTSVTVPVRDRGPFAHKSRRCVDLSLAAARELGMGFTVARVRVEHLR